MRKGKKDFNGGAFEMVIAILILTAVILLFVFAIKQSEGFGDSSEETYMSDFFSDLEKLSPEEQLVVIEKEKLRQQMIENQNLRKLKNSVSLINMRNNMRY